MSSAMSQTCETVEAFFGVLLAGSLFIIHRFRSGNFSWAARAENHRLDCCAFRTLPYPSPPVP